MASYGAVMADRLYRLGSLEIDGNSSPLSLRRGVDRKPRAERPYNCPLATAGQKLLAPEKRRKR